jgi:hypothetical protein
MKAEYTLNGAFITTMTDVVVMPDAVTPINAPR